MITKIFNGKIYFKKKIKYLTKKKFIHTKQIAIITTNNSFSTNLYTKNKIKSFILTKIIFKIFKFTENIKIKSLIKIIKIINKDKKIIGLIIQAPIPQKLKKKNIFKLIKKKKDIEMLNPENFGLYALNYKKKTKSCTTNAIITILKIIKINIKNTKVIIFGFSNIVGKPLFFELNKKGAIITIANKKNKNYKTILAQSDVVISAIGNLNINIKNIAAAAVIIDIGITKKHIIKGDLNPLLLKSKASFITPVPGGVGFLTIINLILTITKTSIFMEKKNGRSQQMGKYKT